MATSTPAVSISPNPHKSIEHGTHIIDPHYDASVLAHVVVPEHGPHKRGRPKACSEAQRKPEREVVERSGRDEARTRARGQRLGLVRGERHECGWEDDGESDACRGEWECITAEQVNMTP